MKHVSQTKFLDQHGEGNCLSACLASLLDLGLDQVPNLETIRHLGALWQVVLETWLASRGYQLVVNADLQRYHNGDYGFPNEYRNVPYMAYGDAGHGTAHACIFINGGLLHDPNPDGLGFHGEIMQVLTSHHLPALFQNPTIPGPPLSPLTDFINPFPTEV